MNTPKKGSLTIIGGQWRSRKIEVLDADGLRPTPKFISKRKRI
jgi:16S rRNA G966 N2-methylase RsmD